MNLDKNSRVMKKNSSRCTKKMYQLYKSEMKCLLSDFNFKEAHILARFTVHLKFTTGLTECIA